MFVKGCVVNRKAKTDKKKIKHKSLTVLTGWGSHEPPATISKVVKTFFLRKTLATFSISTRVFPVCPFLRRDLSLNQILDVHKLS